jgi:hypothetical protein
MNIYEHLWWDAPDPDDEEEPDPDPTQPELLTVTAGLVWWSCSTDGDFDGE